MTSRTTQVRTLVLTAMVVLSAVAMASAGLAGSAVAAEEPDDIEALDGEAPVYELEIPNDGNAYSVGIPGPIEGTVGDVIQGDPGQNSAIVAYDAEEGWHSVSYDEELEALDAIVIITDGEDGDDAIDVRIEFKTGMSPTDHELDEGWNFVAAPAYEDTSAVFELNDMLQVQDRIPRAHSDDLPEVEPFHNYYPGGTSYDVDPFKGYHIYVEEDAAIPSAVSEAHTKADFDAQLGITDDPGAEVDGIDLRLDDEQLVEGETTDATVTASYDDGSTSDVTNDATLSSDDPAVSIDGPTVVAEQAGEATIEATYEDGGETFTDAATVTVTPDGPEPGSIAGEVGMENGTVDRDVDVTVTASAENGSQTADVTIAENASAGSYEIDDLAPGQYDVTAEVTGSAAEDYEIAGDGRTVTVEEGETTSGVDFTLEPSEFEPGSFTATGEGGYLDIGLNPIELPGCEDGEPAEEDGECITALGDVDPDQNRYQTGAPPSVNFPPIHAVPESLNLPVQIDPFDGVEGDVDLESGEVTLEGETEALINPYAFEGECALEPEINATTGESGNLSGEPLEMIDEDTGVATVVDGEFVVPALEPDACGEYDGQQIAPQLNGLLQLPAEEGNEFELELYIDMDEADEPADPQVESVDLELFNTTPIDESPLNSPEPVADTEFEVGENVSAVAEATYLHHAKQDVTTEVTIESEDTDVVSVENTDQEWTMANVSAVGPGETTLTVSYEGASAELPVSVVDPDREVDSIDLSLDDDQLEEGESTEASVTATYDDGSSQDVTDEAELSADGDAVSIDGTTVVAEQAGEATVTAAYENETDSAGVTVSEPTPADFQVSIDDYDESVPAGSDLGVEATIENAGGQSGTQDVTLLHEDGTELDANEGLSLDSGQSESVNLRWTTTEDDVADAVDLTVATDDDEETVPVEVTPDDGGNGGDFSGFTSYGQQGTIKLNVNHEDYDEEESPIVIPECDEDEPDHSNKPDDVDWEEQCFVIDGEIHDDGTWSAGPEDVTFPNITTYDPIETVVVMSAPNGLEGDIDLDTGEMTVEGDLMIEAPDVNCGTTTELDVTTGQSIDMEGEPLTIQDSTATGTWVDNSLTVPAMEGSPLFCSTANDEYLLPSEEVGENEFDLDVWIDLEE